MAELIFNGTLIFAYILAVCDAGDIISCPRGLQLPNVSPQNFVPRIAQDLFRSVIHPRHLKWDTIDEVVTFYVIVLIG